MNNRIINAVEKHRELICNAERAIWKTPETGFKEWKTSAYLTEQFEKLGYETVQAGNIPGFYADLDTGRPGPIVCIMGELDSVVCMDHPEANPETGAVHSCGHNAQCAGLLGVAAALKEPGITDDMCGKVRLMAVPAEELIELEYRQNLRKEGKIKYFGGKVEFLHRGYLDGVDAAIMIHTITGTDTAFVIDRGTNGCILKNIEFEGYATHASAPRNSINALYAANIAMNAINAIRETFDDYEHTRVHPIITRGGTIVNAIPSQVTLESYIRGASVNGIMIENKKINRALAASAAAMGANVRVVDTPGYGPLHNDPTLNSIMQEAYDEVSGDRPKAKVTDNWGCGCTDMGDISSVIPSIQPYIAGASGEPHGKNYQITDADLACVMAAKCQTMLVYKLLCNGGAEVKRVKENAKLEYSSFEEYFAAIENIRLDKKLVEYGEDGIVLHV